MRKHIVLAAATAAALFISGCANMSDTQRRTATGAGVGAAAGAVLGAVTGGRAGTGAVIGAGVGALGTYIWSQNMEKQKREMEQATQGTGVNVSQTADNQLKLDIPSDISFDVGRSAIKGDFAGVLNQFATSLNANQGTVVSIVGHTDSQGSDAINNPLSVDRANATRRFWPWDKTRNGKCLRLLKPWACKADTAASVFNGWPASAQAVCKFSKADSSSFSPKAWPK